MMAIQVRDKLNDTAQLKTKEVRCEHRMKMGGLAEKENQRDLQQNVSNPPSGKLYEYHRQQKSIYVQYGTMS